MPIGGFEALGDAGNAGVAGGAGDVENMAGCSSALPINALIRTRDGTVDSWGETVSELPHLKLDDPGNLERWDPRARVSIVDFEVYSRLAFADDGQDTVTVSHLHEDEDGILHRRDLAELTRPPEKTFVSQLKHVYAYAELRAERTLEILAQPDLPMTFLSFGTYPSQERAQWTLELLTAASRLAHYVSQRTKHALACRRPSELSARVHPIVPVPLHGALPSGHATEAFTVAAVLCELVRASQPKQMHSAWRTQSMRLANRIAVNRTIAGVNFPVDNVAGAVLGLTLGNYLVARSKKTPALTAWAFDGSEIYPPDLDFDWSSLYKVEKGHQTPAGKHVIEMGPEEIDTSPILEWLWKKALAEWRAPKPQDR